MWQLGYKTQYTNIDTRYINRYSQSNSRVVSEFNGDAFVLWHGTTSLNNFSYFTTRGLMSVFDNYNDNHNRRF